MPLVRIDIAQGRSAEIKRAILDGVHAALVEAFKIPDSDRNQILNEHAPANLEGKGSDFTQVEIIAFPGRSRDAKRALYAAIVRNLEKAAGIDPQHVVIVVHEPPFDNWGLYGGQMGSEIKLGFKVDV